MRERERERIGRVERLGRRVEPEQRGDHPRDLRLVGAAVADERFLRDRGSELDDLAAARRSAREHDAAALADPQRGLHVARGEGHLDDDRRRAHESDQAVELGAAPGEARGHAELAVGAQRAGREQPGPARGRDDRAVADDARPGVDAEDDRQPRQTGLVRDDRASMAILVRSRCGALASPLGFVGARARRGRGRLGVARRRDAFPLLPRSVLPPHDRAPLRFRASGFYAFLLARGSARPR